MRTHSLTLRIILYALGVMLLVFFAVFTYYDIKVRAVLLTNTERNARNVSNLYIEKTDFIIDILNNGPDNLADFLSKTPLFDLEITAVLQQMVMRNPAITGAGVVYSQSSEFTHQPYVYSDHPEGLLECEMDSGMFNRYRREFLDTAIARGKPSWSDPYTDTAFHQTELVTYGAPFFELRDGRPATAGVVFVDVPVNVFSRAIDSLNTNSGIIIVMVSHNGDFVVSPNADITAEKTVFDYIRESGDTNMLNTANRMLGGQTGFGWFHTGAGRNFHIAYAPVSSSNWSIGVIASDSLLFRDVNTLKRYSLIAIVAGILMLMVLLGYVMNRAMKPLVKLADATQAIGNGNFGVPLPSTRLRNEVGILTDSFRSMQVSLAAYIRNLETTTREKERMSSELSIAREIQKSFIPGVFPPFPDRTEIDVFASLIPAREVSGDYYDFFFVSPDKLCFAIGDVSGKGVHAALFMAVTRTLIRAKAAESFGDIRKMMELINAPISDENPNMMFVTGILCILNIETGELSMVNAGHNYPYLYMPGKIQCIRETHGLPLGLNSKQQYKSANFVLKPGESVFLYTDGITEAMDIDNRQFGTERLENILINSGEAGPEEVCNRVLLSVNEFVGSAETSDDITLLSIQFHGNKR